MQASRTIAIAAIAAVLAIAIFVWPTMYRYEKLTVRGNSYPVRINRITGETATFYGDEWVVAKSDPPTKEEGANSIPWSERAKITGKAGFWGEYFSGNLYNGSDWVITEVTIHITAKAGAEELWKRSFNHKVSIDPLTTGKIFITVGERVEEFGWYLEDVRGHKP